MLGKRRGSSEDKNAVTQGGMSSELVEKALAALAGLHRSQSGTFKDISSVMQATTTDLHGPASQGDSASSPEVEAACAALTALATDAEASNDLNAVSICAVSKQLSKALSESMRHSAALDTAWRQLQPAIADSTTRATELQAQVSVLEKQQQSSVGVATGGGQDEVVRRLREELAAKESSAESKVGLHKEKIVCLEAEVDSLRSRLRSVTSELEEANEALANAQPSEGGGEGAEDMEAQLAELKTTVEQLTAKAAKSAMAASEATRRVDFLQSENDRLKEELTEAKKKAADVPASPVPTTPSRPDDMVLALRGEIAQGQNDLDELRKQLAASEDAAAEAAKTASQETRARQDAELQVAALNARLSSAQSPPSDDSFSAVLTEELGMMRSAYEEKLKAERTAHDTDAAAHKKLVTELRSTYDEEVATLKRRVEFFQRRAAGQS